MVFAAARLLSITLGTACALRPPTQRCATGRRQALSLGAAAALGATLCSPQKSLAFENAIPEYAQYADKAKRRGTPPNDLGMAKRTINADSIDADPVTFSGLRGCDGKPNCFSTTGDDLLADRIQTGVDTLIKPWKPPSDDAAPFKSLVAVAKAYKPGQGSVDGGGFQVVKESETYLYMQFEGGRPRFEPTGLDLNHHQPPSPEKSSSTAQHSRRAISTILSLRSARTE